MAFEIIMPKLGVDMQEGEIIEWKKQEGDTVNEGDILLEIMSDKTNMEIEAEDAGVLLKIVRKDGETVPVTEVIGYIGAEGESVDEVSSSASSDAKATENLESAGLEVPKAKADDAAPAKADKAPLADNEYDIVVVGGGPAGYYGAIRAAQLGGKVAIIEKSEFGGTCLNVGCIPTKTYLKNAEILDGIKIAAGRGINLASTNYTIDMDKTVDFKNSVVKTLTGGVKGLLKSNKVTLFNGLGQVNPDKTVTIGSETIKGRSIILATGSKVSRINIPGIDSKLVLTSDDILDLREMPKSLAVMGGGVVGIELGLVWASYGVDVTVVEMADRIIPAMDKDVSLELQKILAKKGMKIKTSVGVSEIVEENNQLTLKLNNGEEIVAEKALLSIGRVPQMNGLENLNLDMERNRIKVNEYQETSIPGIYAPGDVNGTKMLAHAAFRMGEVAAENAMRGNTRKVNLEYTPAAVYTHPEVAMVGLTEEDARAKYGDVLVGRNSFTGNGRAIASNEAQGFVKVIADAKFHEILGVHIVGPAAAEMINEAATIMESELTVDELLLSIHGHPTFSEVMYEAFADVLGEAIHNPPKRK
ncbi:dihydrolipoyl dehydrogenase [Streptococcus parauberis]|uniref:Dihydrolipoyl dehydrogenase n=2 Tax=Streptococcus parauberis TaxID=1348 RepID=F1Z1D2_9STRE|nr:dihydrolipoyl dehydrogenase [Streptococcus parauberis]EGE54508.1 dihydrolipoyl dehydrogenase [Streptococcus parauberis NCFD 2020]EMF50056.1 Dihydrolipoamide dehydrogenase of acetoin dehydrogenase [Streptococcus parauberis KRS-02109]EMG25649.1 Dihydrolipoamide dehydrogenase of acetoin dehydrogenase [Streptococcus parauberis KRS-02083]MDT2748574.1 dihydrolipoyl dehydrogenase [Streptococcus parauberis]PNY18884.1 Dihydrolipoyl dehydrogenase [Streptococcus parauberis]